MRFHTRFGLVGLRWLYVVSPGYVVGKLMLRYLGQQGLLFSPESCNLVVKKNHGFVAAMELGLCPFYLKNWSTFRKT